MLKFKVGDVLVSKDREEDIIEVVKTSDDKIEAYGVIALESSCVGDTWYDGHYMWSQEVIETNYKIKKINLKFNLGDKIRLKGTHDSLDEITGVDETHEAFTYELASSPNYYWTRVSIEDHYELYVEEEKLSFDEYVQKISILCEEQTDLTNEISDLTESRNEKLNKLHKMTQRYEQRQDQIKESIAQIDSKATKKALRKMEIANEIKELNDKLGGN